MHRFTHTHTWKRTNTPCALSHSCTHLMQKHHCHKNVSKDSKSFEATSEKSHWNFRAFPVIGTTACTWPTELVVTFALNSKRSGSGYVILRAIRDKDSLLGRRHVGNPPQCSGGRGGRWRERKESKPAPYWCRQSSKPRPTGRNKRCRRVNSSGEQEIRAAVTRARGAAMMKNKTAHKSQNVAAECARGDTSQLPVGQFLLLAQIRAMKI